MKQRGRFQLSRTVAALAAVWLGEQESDNNQRDSGERLFVAFEITRFFNNHP